MYALSIVVQNCLVYGEESTLSKTLNLYSNIEKAT